MKKYKTTMKKTKNTYHDNMKKNTNTRMKMRTRGWRRRRRRRIIILIIRRISRRRK